MVDFKPSLLLETVSFYSGDNDKVGRLNSTCLTSRRHIPVLSTVALDFFTTLSKGHELTNSRWDHSREEVRIVCYFSPRSQELEISPSQATNSMIVMLGRAFHAYIFSTSISTQSWPRLSPRKSSGIFAPISTQSRTRPSRKCFLNVALALDYPQHQEQLCHLWYQHLQRCFTKIYPNSSRIVKDEEDWNTCIRSEETYQMKYQHQQFRQEERLPTSDIPVLVLVSNKDNKAIEQDDDGEYNQRKPYKIWLERA